MRQAIGELSIVGHEHQSTGVNLQTSHWKQTCLQRVLHQINNATTAVGVHIGADNSLGLVQHDVDMRICATNDAAIHFNFIFFRVHPSWKRVKNNAVHTHTRLSHQFFALTSAGNARLREHFLNALAAAVISEWMRGG